MSGSGSNLSQFKLLFSGLFPAPPSVLYTIHIHSITIHNTTLIVLALLFSVLCLMYFLCSRYATQILFICVLGENVCSIPLKKIVL